MGLPEEDVDGEDERIEDGGADVTSAYTKVDASDRYALFDYGLLGRRRTFANAARLAAAEQEGIRGRVEGGNIASAAIYSADIAVPAAFR